MKHLVWLASYPKSGNTWVRVLLSRYFDEPTDVLDLDDLDGSHHAASRVLFDRVVGIPAADLLPDEIDALRPEVYRTLNSERDEPLFVKSHDRFSLTSNGDPMFPADATRLVVVIVRNPLGVAPSFAAHYSLTVDEAIERMADEHFGIALSTSSLPPQLPQRVGSWSNHVASWVDQEHLPTFVLRYEDLSADPAHWFSQMLRACGVEPDPQRVAAAVEDTGFDRLQSAERAAGFKERVGDQPFFRRGDPGGWRQELTAEQIERVVHHHARWMERLGYDPADR